MTPTKTSKRYSAQYCLKKAPSSRVVTCGPRTVWDNNPRYQLSRRNRYFGTLMLASLNLMECCSASDYLSPDESLGHQTFPFVLAKGSSRVHLPIEGGERFQKTVSMEPPRAGCSPVLGGLRPKAAWELCQGTCRCTKPASRNIPQMGQREPGPWRPKLPFA